MANTKNLDPQARKRAKRKLRAAFKQKLADLTIKERKERRKFEGTDAQFLAELEKKRREKAKEAAAAAEAPAAEGGEAS